MGDPVLILYPMGTLFGVAPGPTVYRGEIFRSVDRKSLTVSFEVRYASPGTVNPAARLYVESSDHLGDASEWWDVDPAGLGPLTGSVARATLEGLGAFVRARVEVLATEIVYVRADGLARCSVEV